MSVYALIDPRTNEVRYIGVTGSPDERRLAHRHYPSSKRSAKQEWVAELAADGVYPGMVLLEEVPLSQWEAAERRWIAHYRALGVRLTNSSDGGDGAPGPKTYPEGWSHNWQLLRERACIVAAGILGISVEQVTLTVRGAPGGRPRLVSDEEIWRALTVSNGKIRPAARALGVDESTLRARMKHRSDDPSVGSNPLGKV